MNNAEETKKKRRIPEDLRKRALVSCDRCKKRRVRCLRTAQQSACQACTENGVKCESTLPRKQRIYGSIETLSIRYRVLDALIKGLYPNHDTDSIDVLYDIAEKSGIEVPSSSHEGADGFLLNQAQSPVSKQDPGTGSKLGDVPIFEAPPIPQTAAEMPTEKVLTNAQGGPSHYIGPSASFGFVLEIRNLVAQYNAGLKAATPSARPAPATLPSQPTKLSPIYKGKEKEASAWTNSGDFNGKRLAQTQAPATPPLLQAEVLATQPLRPLATFLPARPLADQYVEAYFEKVHSNFMVLHPATFMTRYHSTWNERKLIQDVEPGWIGCLCLVLVFGIQELEPDKDKSMELQRRFLGLVLPRVHLIINTSNLMNIQALLLTQLYQHNNRERNSAWMLLGCAARMAIALGIHQERSTGGFDEVDRDMRRQVWWTLYNFEHTLCMMLGRPTSIDETDMNVELPSEAVIDSLPTQQIPDISQLSVPIGYLEHSVRLTKLVIRIKFEMYDRPDDPLQPDLKAISANKLLDALDEWYHNLPPSLHLESMSPIRKHQRAVLSLHIQFRHTQSLVCRPYILRKVGAQLAFHLGWKLTSPGIDPRESRLSHLCCNFARQVVVHLHQLSTFDMLDGVAWLDFYYLYHAVLILALDFLARPRDQLDTAEDTIRKAAVREALDAVRKSRLCPTFTFLIQVSVQLAKIVGIFDESYTSPIWNPPPPPVQQHHLNNTPQPPGVEELINEWFHFDPTNAPWHFYGATGSGELDNSNMLPPASNSDMVVPVMSHENPHVPLQAPAHMDFSHLAPQHPSEYAWHPALDPSAVGYMPKPGNGSGSGNGNPGSRSGQGGGHF
ncbi:C6 transcription factor [Phlyctema vagabunda]|uniref:C6 transcription factor n=1 Tax=Phlyctema vagabunda TaxID=108571 RepID=A0ABR4P3U7_9HELO